MNYALYIYIYTSGVINYFRLSMKRVLYIRKIKQKQSVAFLCHIQNVVTGCNCVMIIAMLDLYIIILGDLYKDLNSVY